MGPQAADEAALQEEQNPAIRDAGLEFLGDGRSCSPLPASEDAGGGLTAEVVGTGFDREGARVGEDVIVTYLAGSDADRGT